MRTFAREIGVDVRSVEGSGPGGRIDIDDVKRYARERGSGTAAPAGRELPALPDFEQFGPVEREPLSRFRRTVARNMTTTWSQVPLVTLFSSADTSAFEAVRRRYRDAAVASERPADYLAAIDAIGALNEELIRNPNERLQLQALFFRLPTLA